MIVETISDYIPFSDAPKVLPTQTHYVLSEGSKFATLCTVVSGREPLRFEWTKNLQPVSQSDRVVIDTTKSLSTITVNNINRGDGGNYTCSVRNAFGHDS